MRKFAKIVVLGSGLGWMMLVGAVCMPARKVKDARLDQIKLPEGFQIEIFADKIVNPRQMALAPDGTIFVGTRGAGNVYAVRDVDGNFHADTVLVLAKDLNMPNGVAFRNGSLYVAEVHRVWRWDNILDKLDNPGDPVVIQDSLPNETHHGWKYIAFGPDNKLYVPVGAPCNICDHPEDRRYASILRMDSNGSQMEVFAHGVRNSVGFAWHPQTQELWFTDNGRDWLGNDAPNDELNRAPRSGMHFGYPYCHAGSILDPQFGEGKSCKDYTPPAQKLGPHVAALGILFYQGNQFPKEYRQKVLICEHGSWNRSVPIGYRISVVDIDPNTQEASHYQPFAEGWLQQKQAWGRPVAMLEMPDGSILVSDDHADMIYRISYQP
jgi:glucose/arabinose dehydrogenase